MVQCSPYLYNDDNIVMLLLRCRVCVCAEHSAGPMSSATVFVNSSLISGHNVIPFSSDFRVHCSMSSRVQGHDVGPYCGSGCQKSNTIVYRCVCVHKCFPPACLRLSSQCHYVVSSRVVWWTGYGRRARRAPSAPGHSQLDSGGAARGRVPQVGPPDPAPVLELY